MSDVRVALRRERAGELWAQGLSVGAIARELGVDWRTARRDTMLLGKRAVEALDVPRELARLLVAGRAVEADAWRREAPMQALAAQRQQLAVLQVLQGIDLERRLAEVEARLDAVQGVNPWQSRHLQSEARRN